MLPLAAAWGRLGKFIKFPAKSRLSRFRRIRRLRRFLISFIYLYHETCRQQLRAGVFKGRGLIPRRRKYLYDITFENIFYSIFHSLEMHLHLFMDTPVMKVILVRKYQWSDVRIELGTAGWEARMLPLCCAVPPPHLLKASSYHDYFPLGGWGAA